MTFETALRSRLKSDATITTIIGKKSGAPSIDWKERKEGFPYPAIVLDIAFGDRSQNMGGFDSFKFFRTQFRCTAEDPKAAIDLREAVIACIAPEAVEDGVKFLRAQNISHFGRVQNSAPAVLHHEYVEAEIWSGPAN